MNTSRIKIVKMHGAGNDFVLLDHPDIAEKSFFSLAIRLCDRHFGIGADGLLIISNSHKADARMRIINADGCEAEMCGNGIRCIGKYLYDNNRINTLTPSIETLSGIKKLRLHPSEQDEFMVSVDMGEAKLSHNVVSIRLKTESRDFDVTPVSVGNPHCVVVVEDLDAFPFKKIGPQLESHPLFPDKTNVEFAEIESTHSVRQLTWERGVGETLACGTGACATAFALCAAKLTDWPVTVRLRGGNLNIDIDKSNGHLIMTGPAVNVFSTEIDI